jgi:hypothetical protein
LNHQICSEFRAIHLITKNFLKLSKTKEGKNSKINLEELSSNSKLSDILEIKEKFKIFYNLN